MSVVTQTDIRRILLAFEPSGIHQASLDLALQLARAYGAELAGLLIEDLNLLRAAALPFTSEILWQDAGERRFDPELLDRRLRAEAKRLKGMLARQAQTVGVRWSFRSMQAHAIRDTLAGIKNEELMIMGRLSRTPWTRSSMPPRIILLYTDTERYRPFELLAHKLVEALGETVLSVAPHAVWEGLQITQPAQVLSTLRTWRPALVVTPTNVWLERENLLRELLDQFACPLVIINQQDNREV